MHVHWGGREKGEGGEELGGSRRKEDEGAHCGFLSLHTVVSACVYVTAGSLVVEGQLCNCRVMEFRQPGRDLSGKQLQAKAVKDPLLTLHFLHSNGVVHRDVKVRGSGSAGSLRITGNLAAGSSVSLALQSVLFLGKAPKQFGASYQSVLILGSSL
jgi:hypothetical protein